MVPIGLTGTREVLPRDSLLIRGGAVRMRVGDPIATLDLSLQDRTRLTQLLYQRVCELAGAAPEQVSAGS